MNHYNWTDTFRLGYDKAVKQYQQGNRDAGTFFNADETAFLAAIGCTAQELYDFADDACRYNEPSYADAVLIAAARRDYFLVVQHGQPTGQTISMDSLPPKDAAVAGIEWLPRIIAKARAKLAGEMPAELMFGCGGDRKFLKSVDIHPADFLRAVWWAGDDDQKIIAYVQQRIAQMKS
jgi:hypothetical protein